ncbi:MAG: YHYH protein [Alteromonadaceae bacterium]|nr:YHYH protein [Alteromonadaceae bacterium]
MSVASKYVFGVLVASLAFGTDATDFDYDGDGIADVAVRRPSTHYWYIKNSGNLDFNSDRGDGIQREIFGTQSTDIPVPADYDGDGITDIAVRRPSTYTWYVLNSSGGNYNSDREDGIQRVVLGKNADDLPVPADYDGDGIADFAVRRPSTFTWYVLNSSGTNYNSDKEDGIQRVVFGTNSDDIPMPGHYDEDDIADFAVFRPSTGYWYIKNSSGSNYNSEKEDGIQRVQLGQIGDIPVAADYDGDGITDVAIRRPSDYTWYIRLSSTLEIQETEFGLHPEDIPVPADYNGDGKAELAVRRSGDQAFLIYDPLKSVPTLITSSIQESGTLVSVVTTFEDDDATSVSLGAQSGDIPTNASQDEVRKKLDDTNDNGSSTNSLPTANAGEDQNVSLGATVTLDGSASSDDEGSDLTYTWNIRNSPDGSSAQLQNDDTVNPTLTPDVAGNYLVSLVVNDGTDDSTVDRVRIIVSESDDETNNAPVANAGGDQTVETGSTVTLDGSTSSDEDGDALTYSWSFASTPSGSSASLSSSTSSSPSFTADVDGTYVVQLTVNDGTTDSSVDQVTITAQTTASNGAPTANAGSDQSITLGSAVSLDGSASSDPDGDTLSYSWSITSSPSGSSATIQSSTTANASITPDVEGSYVISLVVNDGSVDSDADSMTITVSDGNAAPVANAGEDQTVTEGDSVQLDGTDSYDPDGDTLSYSWSLDSKPDGSSAELNNESRRRPSFTADEAGTYVFSLVVNDGNQDSSSDSVTITANEAANSAPVANAGSDQSVVVGSTVTLDGSGSTDANGDTLTYVWELTSKPDSSEASLDGATSENASFTADISGDYVASLVVNDGTENSDTDTVTITASNTNLDITDMEFTNQSADCADYVGTYYSNVTDIKEANELSGSVTISANEEYCTFAVNEVPNHDFNETGTYKNTATEQDNSFTVPRSPGKADSPTTLYIGLINAITLNGVTIATLPAACYGVGDEELGSEKSGCGAGANIDNPWRYDPMSSLNSFGTDEHNAHTKSDGAYHYHGNPLAMYDIDCENSGSASPVIGFAADGFPVYGKCFDDNGVIREAKSSYVLKDDGGLRQDVDGYETPVEGEGDVASSNYDGQFRGDWEYSEGEGDLDECNGMTVNGQYGYYVTDAFPWLVGCLTGSLDSSFEQTGERLIDLMHSHDHHLHEEQHAHGHPHKH